ncbi:MAG TPA: hypothetical protein VD838_01215, partial [Anaeromyxobacteraceae bacterium]|nr:hypothetical protein [Anaeromyxobacteraceae bacterium]
MARRTRDIERPTPRLAAARDARAARASDGNGSVNGADRGERAGAVAERLARTAEQARAVEAAVARLWADGGGDETEQVRARVESIAATIEEIA